MYINNFCSISTIGEIDYEFDFDKIKHTNVNLQNYCKEPDYSQWLNPMQLRRMTKCVRLAIGASQRSWNIDKKPDSIHIGAALGMISDTLVFLKKLADQDEEMLTPTAFIQSTHNTPSGQIALLMDAHGHNMTFTHKGHSFENAVLDAQLLLNAKNEIESLLGSVDELTQESYDLKEMFGIYNEHVPAGEGSSFFRISNFKKAESIAYLSHFHFFKESNVLGIVNHLKTYFKKHDLKIKATDYIFLGVTETEHSKKIYQLLQSTFYPNSETQNFKSTFGEFPTCSSIGISLCLSKITNQKSDNTWLINNYGDYWSIWHFQAV